MRIIGGGVVSSAVPLLALSISEINENVFNIEIIRKEKKILSSFEIILYWLQSFFFFHTEQLLKANITELDSN